MSAATSFDLESLTITELEELRDASAAAIMRKERAQRERAFEALDKLAAEHGLTKSDLAARYGSRRARSVRPTARYRNPDDPSQTWNGRGRRPKWVEAHVSAGGELKQLAV